MALNGDILGTAIASAVTALSQEQKESVDAVWKTIAGVIVAHIKTSATVAVPATGIMAPNGACTGAATGTIS